MRCAAAVTGLLEQMTGCFESVPHWSTGRLWLLRLGLAELTRPKPIADRPGLDDRSLDPGRAGQVPGHPRHPPRRAARLPAAGPSRHGADRPGADGRGDQALRGRVPGGGRGQGRRPPRHRRRPRGRPPRGGGDLPRRPPRGRRDLRHQAQGGLPAEGPAGTRSAVEAVRCRGRRGEGRHAADRAGGAGAAEPAVEVPLHEPGRVGGLGRGDAGPAG